MTSKLLVVTTGLVLLFYSAHTTAEVLGHISDETEPGAALPEPVSKDDRRIIYRVICTPGGEVLPDCERPFNDTESVENSAPEALDAELEGADLTDGTAPTSKANNKKSKKSSAKKKSAKKPANNKTSSSQ
ncbi:hypothetical protein [Methylomonas sp. MgM2]